MFLNFWVLLPKILGFLCEYCNPCYSFLGVRATATGEDLLEYRALVSYSSSLCDCLLCIHYVAIVLMEIRHLQPVFYIKVYV